MWPLSRNDSDRMPRSSRTCLLRLLAFALILWTSAWMGSAHAQEPGTASVYGCVREHDRDDPIAQVRVILSPGGLEAVTTPTGRFALEAIPFGRYEIRFERVGYLTRVDSMTVGSGNPVDITVRLATTPIELEPIEAVARSGSLSRDGFYDRRELGAQGTFFTRVDIDRRHPATLTDLVRAAPATMVIDGGPGRALLRFSRQVGMGTSGLPGCEPAVFLDGMLIQDQSREPRLTDFNRVAPSAVEAIEMYVGANTPLEYRRNPCGSVLIWTRRGG